jgi:hypothetical protein
MGYDIDDFWDHVSERLGLEVSDTSKNSDDFIEAFRSCANTHSKRRAVELLQMMADVLAKEEGKEFHSFLVNNLHRTWESDEQEMCLIRKGPEGVSIAGDILDGMEIKLNNRSIHTLPDFPKLHSPFVRKPYVITNWDPDMRRKFEIRSPHLSLITPDIAPGYEWVFTYPDVICSEKLNGTNVRLQTVGGSLHTLMNRDNIVDFSLISKNEYETGHHLAIVQGVFNSVSRGWVEEHGMQDGECIGPSINSNHYNTTQPLWVPFSRVRKNYVYKAFYEMPRTFDAWESWMKDIRSLFYWKVNKTSLYEAPFSEGVVFYSEQAKKEGKPFMAKLRRNMFSWYYTDCQLEQKEDT